MTNPISYSGQAHARVGLLGNPSDGYGGRVLAMTVSAFQADVIVEPTDIWDVTQSELIDATVAALRTRRPELVEQPGRITFRTTIPRQVGLSGSSAIIIATLRALANRTQHTWNRVELARTALEVETELLGWTAGPQDRVVQAYEGLVAMDFASPWNPDAYRQLEPALLPPLFIAWNTRGGTASTTVHTPVRERWLAGEPDVVSAMTRFAELASEGERALHDGTARSHWPSLMNEAFGLRDKIWNINDIDQALVGAGVSCGAGVALAGSGGAVVGAVEDAHMLAAVQDAYASLGAGFLVIHR